MKFFVFFVPSWLISYVIYLPATYLRLGCVTHYALRTTLVRILIK